MISLLGLYIFLMPDFENALYEKNYIVDGTCLLICLILYGTGVINKRYDLFSPITFFSFLYINMYYITPIYDLINHNYYWFNVEVFDVGVKSTYIATISYIVFIICYNYKTRKEETVNRSDGLLVTSNIRILIVVMYLFFASANMYYLTSSGKSIIYVLTLGVFGSGGLDGTNEGLGFISVLSYALPSVTLLYTEYGENKPLKIVMFMVMLLMQIARGFRFFVLQIAMMFISYYYLSKKKKPRIVDFAFLTVIVLVPVVLMTMFRNTIRAGDGMDMSSVSGNTIMDALDSAYWGNFRVYKNYYGIVKAVPQMTGYLYGGQTIIYTMIMLIPRAIWASKPGNPGTIAQGLVFGNAAVVGGSAYPGLGEYYYDAGIIGTVLWMALFATILGGIQNRYRYNANNKIDLMIFCTILGCVLQFTIRGYMPSNFWMVVMAMVPYWIVNHSIEGARGNGKTNKKLYI